MNTAFSSLASKSIRAVVLGVTAVALTAGAAMAQPRAGFRGGPAFHGPVYHGGGGYYHRGWGPGVFWGGLGLGIGVAAASNYYYNNPAYYGYSTYPAPVYVSPPVAVDPEYVTPVPNSSYNPGTVESQPQGTTSNRAPNPIYYPRAGQSASQTEQDRQDCNRWASGQQGALNDANVFQRATLACMEGRNYTVR